MVNPIHSIETKSIEDHRRYIRKIFKTDYSLHTILDVRSRQRGKSRQMKTKYIKLKTIVRT